VETWKFGGNLTGLNNISQYRLRLSQYVSRLLRCPEPKASQKVTIIVDFFLKFSIIVGLSLKV
jgi:hypothetical protein